MQLAQAEAHGEEDLRAPARRAQLRGIGIDRPPLRRQNPQGVHAANLVVPFPFSNVGLAQVFRGQNAECVCQGLKNAFEFVGGVPTRIVFDNAIGIGRKVSDRFRTMKLFAAFAAHYGFDFSFCNPNSGYEKGNVENKVGFIRRNLFVPMSSITNLGAYNKHLMPRCVALSDGKPRWLTGSSTMAAWLSSRAQPTAWKTH